jgi:hypothetical protein
VITAPDNARRLAKITFLRNKISTYIEEKALYPILSSGKRSLPSPVEFHVYMNYFEKSSVFKPPESLYDPPIHPFQIAQGLHSRLPVEPRQFVGPPTGLIG